MAKNREGDLVSNRKAFYDYEILETFEAGISLLGTEVKSLKDHGGNIQDAYILVSESGVILKNASISPFRFGSVHNHTEKRERLLLLHKNEIKQLKEVSEQKGLTLIPLALYLKKGFIKVKLGVAKGKKSYDKRDSVKDKEHKRDIDRAMKNDRE